MNIQKQKRLALALLDYHGGMGSGLYAVGSCMLADSDKGRAYVPGNHRGHVEAVQKALQELRTLKALAKHPEAVRDLDVKKAGGLGDRLERFLAVRAPSLLFELKRLGFSQHGPGGWFLALGSGLELWCCDGEGGKPGPSVVLTLENASTGNGLFCERMGAHVAAGMLRDLVP